MEFVATRVLVINRQLGFAVTIKQALEQVGGYQVAPFTSPSAALDHLRQHPHDVALADLTLPELSGPELVFRLRAAQPEIAIIASPRSPDVAAVVHDLDLQGMIDVPCPARELIPLIQQAVAHMRDTLPDTAEAPAVGGDSETLIIAEGQTEPPPADLGFSGPDRTLADLGGMAGEPLAAAPDTTDEQPSSTPIEFVLSDQPENAAQPISPPKPDDTPAHEKQMRIFHQLASEEPALEDSGTVSDLMIGVSDANFEQVVAILKGEEVPAESARAAQDDDPDQKIPAMVILETALDESTPQEAFSLDEFVSNIQEQLPSHAHDIRPLPSWIKESTRYVEEPDFLPQDLSELDQTLDNSIQTTRASPLERLESDPGQLETDRLEEERRSHPAAVAEAALLEPTPEPPVETRQPLVLTSQAEAQEAGDGEPPAPQEEAAEEALPVEAQPVEAELQPEQPESGGDAGTMPPHEVEAHRAELERLAAAPEVEAPAPPETTPAPPPADDPYVAQLAVSLTQVSLELTAEATLLAREGQIVAYAGNLPQEDIEDLRAAVADDWEANPSESRIRFITLPSSGKDYMVYSRRTVSNFTLSMIFSGAMPLRVIRRQSDRLAGALASVPEVIAEPEEAAPPVEAPEVEAAPQAVPELPPPPPAIEVGPLAAITYVWLLRDPDRPITPDLAQAMVADLEQHLAGMSWTIKTFRVHEDYIYLLVEAPAEPPPHEVIHDLMRRSAEIARSKDHAIDPDALWDDSYLVVTPGRELDIEEVQQYINFVRDR